MRPMSSEPDTKALARADGPVLEVSDLRLTLAGTQGPLVALRGIDFSLQRGQIMGLIGESGCGKSLTAMSIMGLQPETARLQGSVRLNGQELVGLSERALAQLRGARMAMVFQEPMTALNPLHTVGQQLCEPLRLHWRMSQAAASRRALELLQRVQLPAAAQRLSAYPHQLSGGQRQRVMIAMALACEPDLLIADEPTTALDVTLQQDILKLMTGLVREDGMSLLLISHDLALMRQWVDRVLVMYGGQVVEDADTEALFARLAHPYTRGLLAARPDLSMARGTRLPVIAGRVPELSSLPAGCAFAPRCVHALPTCHRDSPAWEMVDGRHRVRCPVWSRT